MTLEQLGSTLAENCHCPSLSSGKEGAPLGALDLNTTSEGILLFCKSRKSSYLTNGWEYFPQGAQANVL